MSNNFSYNTRYLLTLRNNNFLKYYCNKAGKSKNTLNTFNERTATSNFLNNGLSLNNKTTSVNLTYNTSGTTQNTNSTLLKAENNILTLNDSKSYKVATGSNSFASLDYDQYGTGSIYDTSDVESNEQVNKLCRFISSLIKDPSGFDANVNNSNSEIKEMLGSVGIKPGWFEITNGSTTNKFYLGEDGLLNSESEVKGQRDACNRINWFKEGYTQNSTFIIDNKEYKLDETGHLHVPDNVPCVQGNFKFTK